MAGCKFQNGKCKGAIAAKASLRHDEIDEESRAIAQKGNKHIDLSMCQYNMELTGMKYSQKVEKYDKRIKELDDTTNTNRRKDRVTLQKIEIPVPKDIDEDRIEDWIHDTYEILVNEYGKENMISAAVHADEQHEYINTKTNKTEMSRIHMHIGVIPEVKGKLDGKHFSSRASMIKLNNKIQKMTVDKYDCVFKDGSGQKSSETVDELKNSSEKAELEQSRLELQQDWNTLNTEKKRLKTDVATFEGQKKKFVSDAKAFKVKLISDTKAECDEMKQDAEEYRLKWQKRLESPNTSSQDYYKFQSKWLKQKGLSEQCLQDYENYIDSKYPEINYSGTGYDLSL